MQYLHQNDKSKLTIVSATHQETAKQLGPVHCCGNLCFQLIVSCHPYFYQQVYIIGLGVSIAKKRKSVVDEELDSSDYDSDEDLVSA